MKNKVNILYKILDCNNTKIAREAGCSPSDISRIRTGSRKYSPASRSIIRFAQGIYMYADKTGALNPLCKLCESKDSSRDEVVKAIIVWLFDNSKSDVSSFYPFIEDRIQNLKAGKKLFFGEKLSKTMELLELSNMRLAKQMNLDASAVSRFRNGVRSPKAPLDKWIADTLFERAIEQNKLSKLSRICGISVDALGFSSFTDWLYEEAAINTYGLDSFLDSLEHFQLDNSVEKIEIKNFVTDEILNDTKSTYWGIEGLREAVIRFLGNTIKNGGELYLYSDQDMSWMVGDPAYQAKWTALMVACIKSGISIRIIHNIDRGISEMLSAIQSWLPLYISGMIEPYICSLGRDARFSKTIFLNQGKECISGSVLKGNENSGWYEYITDPQKLDVANKDYKYLLENSFPLINIYFDDYISSLMFNKDDGKAQIMLSSLSLETMPQAVLENILNRNGVFGEAREKITKTYLLRKQNFEKAISSECVVTEIITLPSDELLFEEKTPIDLPSSICEKELCYTPEDYESHIRSVMRFMEIPNYELVILPEMPFSHLRIIATESHVAVIRPSKPYATFVFSEPRLVRTFAEYFELLKKQYNTDKITIKNKLMRFL